MKIVIDIPDDLYNEIKQTQMFISGMRSGKTLLYTLMSSVANGTPLDDEMMKSYCHGVENTAKEFRYEINKLLNDIKAEIKANIESSVGSYDSNTPLADRPYVKLERNNARNECLAIIDKHIGKE